MSLRPHQERNAALLFEALKKHGGALDASDVGVGKTRSFLALCKMVGARPAVVTRKPVIPAWHRECAAVGVSPLFIANYEECKTTGFQYGKAVVTRKPTKDESRDRILNSYEWTLPESRVLFAFDEVQACRTRSTMNTAMLLSAADKFKTVMLSATPFTNPAEAYAIGRTLRLFHDKSYFSWMMRYGMRKNIFGRMEFLGDSNSERKRQMGLECLERLNGVLFPEYGCRTRRSEIPGFPESLITVEEMETGEATAIEQIYLDEIAEKRREDLLKAQEGIPEELHDLVEVLPLTVNLRARQEVELLKVPTLVEMAKDAAYKGESVCLFVNFDNTIEALAEHLECNCIVRGKKKPSRVESAANAVSRFQANNSPYIIVNNAAGGAGISLHDPVSQKPRTSLISPPWSAILLRQILGRPQRLGGGFSTQKLCFAAGTVEEKVMRRVQNKLSCLDALVDGDLDVTR